MTKDFFCPLLEVKLDDTICYDIQMVMGGFIKKSILDDYGNMLDSSKVTSERANICCSSCAFNQLTGSAVGGEQEIIPA